jgi:hypothetical protein
MTKGKDTCASCGVYALGESYRYGGGAKHPPHEKRHLCVLCANTFAGNLEASKHSDATTQNIMIHINQIAHLFAQAMGIEFSDLMEAHDEPEG